METNKINSEDSKILKFIADKKIFVNAILNPAEPNDYLKSSLKAYNEFVENGKMIFPKSNG